MRGMYGIERRWFWNTGSERESGKIRSWSQRWDEVSRRSGGRYYWEPAVVGAREGVSAEVLPWNIPLFNAMCILQPPGLGCSILPRDAQSPSSHFPLSSRISSLPKRLTHPKSQFYPYLELTNQPDCIVSFWPPEGSEGQTWSWPPPLRRGGFPPSHL